MAPLLEGSAGDGLFGFFEGRHLPHGRPQTLVGAFFKEDEFALLDHEDVMVDFFWFFAAGAEGEFFGDSRLMRTTPGADGTGWTLRVGGEADEGAKFHECLVEVAGVMMGEQSVGQGPKMALGEGGVDVVFAGGPAGEDAHDVAIDEGLCLLIGNGGDCASGVFPDAGQLEEVLNVLGNLLVVVLEDEVGGSVEVSCAAVVAQTLPGGEDLLLGCLSEGGEGGEKLNEAIEIRDDGGDLCLLKHGFADQDMVGIGGLSGCSPPGKTAVVLAVPGEQGLLEFFDLWGGPRQGGVWFG